MNRFARQMSMIAHRIIGSTGSSRRLRFETRSGQATRHHMVLRKKSRARETSIHPVTGTSGPRADFARHGFVTMAQKRVPGLDCVAVDATIGYYFDGSVADRLHREIVGPAHAFQYREIWLVGVSMGGLGAFFHERMHPGDITGFVLLAPFLGEDRNLFAEIDEAGGAAAWASAQPAGAGSGNRATYQRDLWRFLGRLPSNPDSRLQVWVAYGDRDRLIPGIERLNALVPPERVVRLAGGHNWTVWTAGFERILAKIHWTPIVKEAGSQCLFAKNSRSIIEFRRQTR